MKTKQHIKDDIAKEYGFNNESLLLIAFIDEKINKCELERYLFDCKTQIKKQR